MYYPTHPLKEDQLILVDLVSAIFRKAMTKHKKERQPFEAKLSRIHSNSWLGPLPLPFVVRDPTDPTLEQFLVSEKKTPDFPTPLNVETKKRDSYEV